MVRGIVGEHRLAYLWLAALCGCASGASDDGNSLPMIHHTDSADPMTSGDDSLTTGISDSATSEAGSDEGSSGTPQGSTTGMAETTTGPETTTGIGSGSSGGDESSTGAASDDTGAEPMCPNPLTCQTAMVLGQVSGDEASPDLVTQGSESTWLSFQVTEDNDSVSGENVAFTATLQSPAGYDFDLYVWRGAEGATNGCNGTAQQSTAANGVDVVSMSWGEGGVANGADDRRWIAVEIVPKNDMCDPGSQWVLTIEGDT